MAAVPFFTLIDIRMLDGARGSRWLQVGIERIAVFPAFSASGAEPERLIFTPMSDAPPISPNPIKSNSPVDCSAAEEPAVAARATAGRHNRTSAHSNATRFGFIFVSSSKNVSGNLTIDFRMNTNSEGRLAAHSISISQ
jgi:hypothetical protein